MIINDDNDDKITLDEQQSLLCTELCITASYRNADCAVSEINVNNI
jgi:hypothetical protein